MRRNFCFFKPVDITQFPCYKQRIAANTAFSPSHPNSLPRYLPMPAARWLRGPGWSDPSWLWAGDIHRLPHCAALEAFKLIVLGWWDGSGIYCEILNRLQPLLLASHRSEKTRLAPRLSVFIMFAEFWHYTDTNTLEGDDILTASIRSTSVTTCCRSRVMLPLVLFFF